MLVLTRNLGQRILVNGNIAVTVLSVKGNQVRLGVDAPREIIIDREEISMRRQHILPRSDYHLDNIDNNLL